MADSPRATPGLAEISKKRNEWETAIDYLKRSIDAFSKLRWAKGVARSKYELALAYKKQSAFQEVVPLLTESLKLFEEIGDYSGQVLCLRELLAEPIEIREALELSDRAFQLVSEMDEPPLIASLVPLKLRWLVEAQQPDSALEFYASHYQLLIETSQELYFPLSQIQITRALMQQYRYQEARQQIEQPLQTFTIMGNQYCLSNAMMVSGELHLQENDLNAAHQYLDEAGAIAERLNDNELSLEVNLIRARLLRAEGETVPLLQLYLNTATLAESLGRHQLAQKIHASINELKV